MGAVGLQTHIWNNNLRSGFLLAGFPVLLLVIVFAATLALVGSPGYAAQLMVISAPAAIVVSLVWFAIAYFANTTIIDLATGAHPVERKDAPELYNLLENLAISRGIATPTLRIIDSEELNAFASGVHAGQYSITLTRGIIETLDRDELEGVLAHELTHILSRDVRTMVIASVFAGIITLIAQIIFRVIMWGGIGGGGGRRDDRRGGSGPWVLVALAAAAIGYVLAILIRMALSRSREFVADAGAVDITKNPDAMISALQKISGHSHLNAPEAVQSMFIDNVEEGVMGLFATHPPIDKRIEALVQYAGGRPDAPIAQHKVALPADMPAAPDWAAGQPGDPPISGEASEGPWSRPQAEPRGPWG
jgi:heat shock protein HtpX